jgi:hypothetical protein
MIVVMAAGLIALAAMTAMAIKYMPAQVQTGIFIPGMLEKRVTVPSEMLTRFRTTKQTANLAVLRETYVMRDSVPFIKIAGKEYALLPLEVDEYAPTEQEIGLSQKLPPLVARHQRFILKQPPLVGRPVSPPPDRVDRRDKQTSIKDQGGRLTCVCFASMAGLEAVYGGGTLDLSENYANYLYMKAEGRPCKDAGLQTHMSADYLSANTVGQESLCPYQYAFPGWCTNGGAATAQRTDIAAHAPYGIMGYQKIWRKDDLTTDAGAFINNPAYLEAILASGRDIIFGTHVAGWSGNCTGVLDVQLDPSGNPLPSTGGHAMLIVGYDRPGQYFIVKNSWGTDKGQAGYFYLSYDYIRTYAKYGYYITAVKPVIRALPRTMPVQILPRSDSD